MLPDTVLPVLVPADGEEGERERERERDWGLEGMSTFGRRSQTISILSSFCCSLLVLLVLFVVGRCKGMGLVRGER